MSQEGSSLLAVYGSAWEVLSDREQAAMQQASTVEQARAILAISSLQAFMQPGETVESEVLRRRLAGMYLSELRAVANMAEDLAKQLKIAPYAGHEAVDGQAKLIALPPKQPGVAEQVDLAKLDGTDTEPVEDTVKKRDYAPDDEVAATEQPAGEAVTSISNFERKVLIRIFGSNAAKEIDELSRQQIDGVFRTIQEVYVASNKKKHSAQAQVYRLNLHLQGKRDADIAWELSLTPAAITQGRQYFYRILSRHNLKLTDIVSSLQQSDDGADFEEVARVTDSFEPEPQLRPTEPVPGASVSEVPVTMSLQEAGKPTDVRLREAIDELGDSIGLPLLEKQAAQQRLDKNHIDPILTKDAKAALTAFGNKAHRLISRGKLELDTLERQILDDIVGADGSSMLPLQAVIGAYYNQLDSAKLTVSDVLCSVFEKINQANREFATNS